MSEANETNQHPVTEFTIDRSRWARRGKNGLSRLLNGEGSRCCLGFAAKACGASDEQILGWGTPAGPGRSAFQSMPWLFEDDEAYLNSEEGRDLIGANDGNPAVLRTQLNSDKSEEALEAFITKTFASRGVTVHFVDGPVTA